MLLYVGRRGVLPLIGRYAGDPVIWAGLPEHALASEMFGVGQAQADMQAAAYRTCSDAFREMALALRSVELPQALADTVYFSEEFLAPAALWADAMVEQTDAAQFAGVKRSRGRLGYKFHSLFLLHCLNIAQQLTDDKNLAEVVATSQALSQLPSNLQMAMQWMMSRTSRKGLPLRA